MSSDIEAVWARVVGSELRCDLDRDACGASCSARIDRSATRGSARIPPIRVASLRGLACRLTISYVTAEEEVRDDLVGDLLAPIPRPAVVPAVQATLGLPQRTADRIVQAFDDFVAKPLEANLKKLQGRDLAKRNPMIYT